MKTAKKLICALLVALMAISVFPISAFATEYDIQGNEIIDTRPEYYVPPRLPTDTIAAGKEPAMPIPEIAPIPDPEVGFDVEIEPYSAPADAIALPDADFDVQYKESLGLPGASFTLEGDLPFGIEFDSEKGVVYGKSDPNEAGKTFVFTVTSDQAMATYAIYVPYKGITSIEIDKVAYPRVGKEASYGGNVTFMAGKTKLFGGIDTMTMDWKEMDKDKNWVPFDFYKYGKNYRLVAEVNLPVGYVLQYDTYTTLDGMEVRVFPNNIGSRFYIYYFYYGVGIASVDYVVTYEYGTTEATADLQYPISRTLKKNVEPYNFTPIPDDPEATGYIFAGWFTDEERTKPYNFNALINHNRTLYAKWITIIYDVQMKTSNMYPSENIVRPTISIPDNAKYHIVRSDWLSAVDDNNPDNDIIYYGDLEAGQTYMFRVAIKPNTGWGVWDASTTSIRALANVIMVENHFSLDHETLYVYMPVTILSGPHEHELRHYREVPATCFKDGKKEYWECKSCGQIFLTEDAVQNVSSDTLIIPALGHNWGEWEVYREAKCTKMGEVRRYCQNNKSHYESDSTDALGHTWGEWVIQSEATETRDGKMYRTCEVCGAHESQRIPAVSHVHKMKFVAGYPATCTRNGQVDYYTCTVCNKRFLDESGQTEIDSVVIEPLGHNWGEWIVTTEPTKEAEGIQTRMCLNDPTHFDTAPVDKLPPETPTVYGIAKAVNADWQRSDNSTISMTSNMPFDKFDSLEIDGNVIDASHYEVSSGVGKTAQVTMTTGFLKQLSDGEHQVRMRATDGYADTVIRISGNDVLSGLTVVGTTKNVMDAVAEVAEPSETFEISETVDGSEIVVEQEVIAEK